MSKPYQTLKEDLLVIYNREELPDKEEYLKVLDAVHLALDGEEEEYRPRSDKGDPGGLIYLDPDLDTIVVPDLHARMNFFLNILLKEEPGDATVLEKLNAEEIQIVCVGDGFHAEARAIKRWLAAFQEYSGSYKKHKNMDEEMRESLGLMEMVMEVKSCFPRHFHFLKGNHENITNEQGDGNYSFGKFAYEGAMVTYWVQQFYGEEFLSRYYHFEKKLPLLAVGRNFLVSHAEPEIFFPEKSIIEYRDDPDVVYGLTWTDNDAAEDGSVHAMLNHYLDSADGTYYFGGHRPIEGSYYQRAGGCYVQIHNPNRFVIAYLKADKDIDLEEDIIMLEDMIHGKNTG